jgi:hypothetical protein
MNGQSLSALDDTGADICCMSSKAIRRVFPVEQRPEKLNWTSSVSAASSNKLMGTESMLSHWKSTKGNSHTYTFHIFSNVNEDFILGINFFKEHGLGYNPTSQELYWTDDSALEWNTASLQCPEKITINPVNNQLVTLNIITEEGYRIADPCETMATTSSWEHVAQGVPALVRINRIGQTNMEIFNCTNNVMAIEKDTILGRVKKLTQEDKVGEFKVNKMTVNLEQKEMKPSAKMMKEKRKYILDNVNFTSNEDLTDSAKQKYMKPSVIVSLTLVAARTWLMTFSSRNRILST